MELQAILEFLLERSVQVVTLCGSGTTFVGTLNKILNEVDTFCVDCGDYCLSFRLEEIDQIDGNYISVDLTSSLR